jgi:hypothetical protein
VGRGALSISKFCTYASIGRTSAFTEIKAGRLIARKRGRSTIILIEDADAWLQSLPLVHTSAPGVVAAESGQVKRKGTDKRAGNSSGGKDKSSRSPRQRTSGRARGPPQDKSEGR